MASAIIINSFKCTFPGTRRNSSQMITSLRLTHKLQGSLWNAASTSILTPCTCACFSSEAFSRLIHTERKVKSTPFLSSTNQLQLIHKNYESTSQFKRDIVKSGANAGAKEVPLSSAKNKKKTAPTKQSSLSKTSSKSNLLSTTSRSIPSSIDPLESSSLVGKLQFNPEEWKMVYRFTHMRAARAVQKLKIYQTVFTTFIALPVSFLLFLMGTIPHGYVTFMLGMSTLACVMLYIMGTFCSRLIGYIYVSKSDPTVVRVAHLNFWGKRVDEMFKKADFVPFSELPDNVRDAYVNVKFYVDPDTTMHICTRYGGEVFDKLEFIDIFGDECGLKITDEEMKKMKDEKS